MDLHVGKEIHKNFTVHVLLPRQARSDYILACNYFWHKHGEQEISSMNKMLRLKLTKT